MILCNNINFNQYFNLYLHKKPLINKFNKSKETFLYNIANKITMSGESLQYSILQGHSLCLNNYNNIFRINSVISIYLKKYHTSLLHYGNINMDLNYKRNIVNYKLYYNYYIPILNNKCYSGINYTYKSTSNYFNKKNVTVYNEIQNENKLLNRKTNISKYQTLI